MKPIIGIDFDNTIINYNSIIYREALKRGLIPAGIKKQKTEIRDWIRLHENSGKKDQEWQKLQAVIYGTRISEAEIFEGVESFFVECARRKINPYIISHKTEFGRYEASKIKLRSKALEWMEKQGLFRQDRMGILNKNVFFCSSRDEKIQRIRQVGCTYFIDDLIEVFLDKSFPNRVKKILFSPDISANPQEGSKTQEMYQLNSWNNIKLFIFN